MQYYTNTGGRTFDAKVGTYSNQTNFHVTFFRCINKHLKLKLVIIAERVFFAFCRNNLHRAANSNRSAFSENLKISPLTHPIPEDESPYMGALKALLVTVINW